MMGRLSPDEHPVTGGDRVEVVVNASDDPDVWAMDGRIGYVQRRYVNANEPVVEVVFPPTNVRKQITRRLLLDSVKRKPDEQ